MARLLCTCGIVAGTLLALVCAPTPMAAQGAERLYSEACDAGDGSACGVLALMLETGTDLPQDLPRAASLYERACALGVFAGCANLGLMHETGRGVTRDVDRARMLHAVACRGGEPLACDRLGALDDITAASVAPGARQGRVRHILTGDPVGETLITAGDDGVSVLSDPAGFFTIPPFPDGEYPLRADRVGYEAVEGRIEFPFEGDLLVLMTPAEVEDPNAPGRLEGRVLSDGGDGLANVEVSVVGQSNARTVTNDAGRFSVAVTPGTHEVQIASLGYSPRSVRLVVHPARITEVSATLSTEAIELEPIDVMVRSSYLERNGFYQRQRMGFGRFFDIRDIEEINASELSDIVRRVPGVRIVGGRRGGMVVAESRRAIPWGLNSTPGQTIFAPVPYAPQDLGQRGYTPDAGCTLAVYVDGVPAFDADLEWIPPNWIEAVEVYNSGFNAPLMFGGMGMASCGAVIVWTRR